MTDDIVFDVRRVSWNFYTWRLKAPGADRVGYGTKTTAEQAVAAFVRFLGGREMS